MNCTYTSIVQTRLFADVPEAEQENVLKFAHHYACGGDFGQKRTAEKILQVGYFGQQFLKIHRIGARLVIGVKESAISPEGMRCPSKVS